MKGQSSASRTLEHVVERVSEIMARHQLVELEWQDGQERLRLCKAGAHQTPVTYAPGPAHPYAYSQPAAANPAPASPAAPSQSTAPAAPAAPARAEDANGHSNQKKVLAPFVGTFYRATSPEAAPYVKEGQNVRKGDPLCIIEAMKLMNELESEYTGKIVSVLVENGQPVEFGEPLFTVEV